MHVRHLSRIGTLAVTAVALALPVLGSPASAAEGTVEVVTENDVTRQPENTPPTDDWVLYTRTPASVGVFEEGPAEPPLGTGSLGLTTPTSADKVFLFTYDHVGTALADIDEMGYSTHRTAGALQQVTALNIQIDQDGPDGPLGFATLVFEPVYNTDQGAVVSGEWQDWDAYNGGQAHWWSTRPIPGATTFTVTWNQIVAAYPGATILGGYGVNQGSGNPGLDANVDALAIGHDGTSVTYDFEHFTTPPTSSDECKDGGWESFNDPAYRNQGECVSDVRSNSGGNGGGGDDGGATASQSSTAAAKLATLARVLV